MTESFWKKIIRRKQVSLLSLPALLLWLVVPFYKIGLNLKKKRTVKSLKVKVPVISVGNITVGGTGKTPLCAQLGRFLSDEGFKVGIASSGYGRDSKELIVAPGYQCKDYTASQLGDEIKYLSTLLPDIIFAVATKKADAADVLAQKHNPDVIIIDDGYQHFQLERDINIVTYDAALESRLLKPFPAGMLREPLKALNRADIIVITRAKFARDIEKLRNRLASFNNSAQLYQAGFSASHIIGKEQSLPVKYLEDKHVLLFAGIGNFKSLRKQVFTLCADLDEAVELSDHQEYSREILEDIKQKAEKHDSDIILTTGKDWVKIENFDFGREFYYLNQQMDLDPGEEKLVRYLVKTLGLRKTEN